MNEGKRTEVRKTFQIQIGIDKSNCTDKKEKKIVLIDKKIQKGLFAKSYVTNGLLIYG